MQKFSYHTHTNFSDGKNSVEEMIKTAVKLGWEELGLSDHLIVHKNANIYGDYQQRDFEECLDFYQKRSDMIRRIAKKYSIKTLIGFEVDYFLYDGWEDEFKNFLKQIDHDYLISGNHFFCSDDDSEIMNIWFYNNLINTNSAKTHEYIIRHYETMCKAIKSGLFDFLAHPDYVRRVEGYGNFSYKNEQEKVIKALVESGIGCEISTKGIRNCGCLYPENKMLEMLVEANVPMVVSDDAHSCMELGYFFDVAEKALDMVGCHNRLRLK